MNLRRVVAIAVLLVLIGCAFQPSVASATGCARSRRRAGGPPETREPFDWGAVGSSGPVTETGHFRVQGASSGVTRAATPAAPLPARARDGWPRRAGRRGRA